MRNRFDQLGKELALKVLAPLGGTTVQYALNAETLFADLRHEPAPEQDAARQRLGLLGQLAQTPCLIELYSQPPGSDEFRTCFAKHLTYMHERARNARAVGNSGGYASGALWTWIVSAGVPRTLLAGLAFRPMPQRPDGLYVLGGDVERLGCNIGLVVTSELPVDASTLLIRIMAGGTALVAAIRELASLPVESYERIVAEPVVLGFQHALERDTTRKLSPEEKEFIMVVYKSWEDARAEGRAEGRVQGHAEARVEMLRRQLTLKFGDLSPEVDQRVAAATSEDIDRYLERVLFVDSIEKVLA